MITALSDNPPHIDQLCERLDLGKPSGTLSRVSGGFHHRMWRLNSRGGSFAIKQLADDLDMQNAATVERINATEITAREFSEQEVPALYSLANARQHLQLLDGVGYLVYPWTEATACNKNGIEKKHALTVAGILARIHRSDIRVPELQDEPGLPLTAERVIDLVQLARQRNVRESQLLEARLDDLLESVELQATAMTVLEQDRVVSHGDLDHKNVLWDKAGKPFIIDWESARKLNPTHEIILEALEWSGITAQFQVTLFEKMLTAYKEAGGIMESDSLEASFHCVMGDWLNWLMYNLGRNIYLEDGESSSLGAEQVELALSTILRLDERMPSLLSVIRGNSGLLS